jgi:hypothetical protein
MIVVLFKEWKGIEIVLGILNLREIAQNLSGFVTHFFTNMGVELGIW